MSIILRRQNGRDPALPDSGHGRGVEGSEEPTEPRRTLEGDGITRSRLYLLVALVMLLLEVQLALISLVTDDVWLVLIAPAVLFGVGFFVSLLLALLAHVRKRWRR